jgi:hypothetical protein
MNAAQRLERIVFASGNALFGGLCGAMLAALGNAISNSPLGAGATIAVAAGLGCWTARVNGLVLGAIVGGLAVGFGAVVGGSAMGAAVTIAVTGILGAWLGWDAIVPAPSRGFDTPTAPLAHYHTRPYGKTPMARGIDCNATGGHIA